MSTKRRSDGEGTVFQRSDGTWVASISLGKDHNGKRRRRSRNARTKKEAVRLLSELRAADAEGPELVEQNVTVAEWCRSWCDTVATTTAKASTVADYRYSLDRWVLPHLGAYRLRDLTPQHCAEMQQALIDAGLSPNTVRHARRPLSAALVHAERTSVIRSNPLRTIRQPPADRSRSDKPRSLDREQALELLQAAANADPNLYGCVTLALLRGVRRGEALGLQWSDIDFDNKVIHIRRNLPEERVRTRDGGYAVRLKPGPPKTAKSRRDLSLGRAIEDVLGQVGRFQEERRRAAGPDWADSGYVFTTATGLPMYPSNIYHRYKKMLAGTGLPSISFHDLRRTWAMLSLEAGVPVEQAQEALGHESIETTKNIYASSVPALADRAFATFDDYIESGPASRADAGSMQPVRPHPRRPSRSSIRPKPTKCDPRQ